MRTSEEESMKLTSTPAGAKSGPAAIVRNRPQWLPADPGARLERPGTVHLTPRQLEVLLLLGEGLPNKLICRQLKISTGTVKVHISCILRELGVTSRLQAVVWA